MLAQGNKREDKVQTGIECLKIDIFHFFLHASEGAIKLFINNVHCLFPQLSYLYLLYFCII